MKLTLIATICLFAAVANVQAAPPPAPSAAIGQPGDENRHWICTCFEPKYDYGCCNDVKGVMMTDGNVCEVPDRSTYKNHDIFEACCTRIGGHYKCK
ncbi:hypothetical protein INT44_003862 [Umbelopsis vinacea]|uniref:Uncharacterized protein n=1 Tax=Umbelopsis vinacea TaxID=44442 RepID=A0A8H7UQW7_9FUNG|nr:hypothetical protein INT44_003862 [Umbelopsis vinacea]